MEERKKNLCAMIPESLHKKVREEHVVSGEMQETGGKGRT